VTDSSNLPLERTLSIGIQTIHRRTEPESAPWQPRIDELVSLVSLVDRLGYDSLWCGDHIAFAVPLLDPLLQLVQAAVVSRRLTFGTAVYLLPLRHVAPVSKQVATLDHLTEGRLIFGVGVGGEFPKEYQACGIPLAERGARLTEAIPLLRRFWSGEPVSHDGRFYGSFEAVSMQPPARQAGGPAIWCGGRSNGALRRTGRLGDGWISYVVTPEMYRAALDKIAVAVHDAHRSLARFGTGHLLFTRIDDSYEQALEAATATLSVRYAMDFRRAAERYCALGRPEQVAERIRAFYDAGVRHIILDLLGPYEQRDEQITRFAAEALPLIKELTRAA
jgi:alkanesulfonate monooxygenase SsuD/methylene tetrahydromethanopterin reductase-like flavin-dependent oxidoreductase (luciferase family)